MTIYDFEVLDADKKSISLSEYKGKVLLIVNTATKCGFTPQYAGLQLLQEQFQSKGFEILDFPCNQFGGQSPLESQAIKNFCQDRFSITFRTFDKIEVNGPNAHPLFVYLKREARKSRLEGSGFQNIIHRIKAFVLGTRIKWNFTKFLVDRNGKVVKRFSSATSPEAIKSYIEKYL